MIFMRYIFGICKFTVKYIVAMLRYAKKLRLRHNLLCYCFHRSVSDCPVEARGSHEKKGFFLAAISKFRSWQKLEFLEKILEFLEKSLEFFEILEFFWPWVFFKMSKKKAWIWLFPPPLKFDTRIPPWNISHRLDIFCQKASLSTVV